MKKSWKDSFMYFLGKEIMIEYKACLYAFCIVVFYAGYALLQGGYTAPLLYLAEMFCTAYVIGYLQVYALWNFDEAEHFGKKEILATLLCAVLYAGISYLFGWFDRTPVVTVVFVLYFIIIYVCVFLINKIKRIEDTKNLNVLLDNYKKGEKKDA